MKKIIFSVIIFSVLLYFKSFATVWVVAKSSNKKTIFSDSLPNSQKEFFIEVTSCEKIATTPEKVAELQDSLEALRFENRVLRNKLKKCVEGKKN